MTRQYIGARYVPRFFENSQGGADWESGVAYEPLTIVTYNGNSYTSKRTVPATIGNPSQNPAYWASTGIYNQQVEELRQQFVQLSEDVDDYSKRLAAAESDLSLIKNRRFLFIGDSWFRFHSGDDYTHFMDMVYTELGLTQGTDYYEIAGGGYGFIGDEGTGRTWLSLLQAETITDPETITDIYIFGGINDRPYTGAQIESAISEFSTYARGRFPNARIKLGCISWTKNSAYNTILRDTIIPAYRNCTKYQMTYIPNMEYSGHIYGCLDGIHPTESMMPYLYNAVMGAILQDRAEVKYCAAGSRVAGAVSNVPVATITLESGFSFQAPETLDGNLAVELDNDTINISMAQGVILLTEKKTLGLGFTKIGTITGGLVYGTAAGKNIYIPVNLANNVAGSTVYETGTLLICNGNGTSAEVYLIINGANKTYTGIRFMQFSASFPTLCA